MAKKVGLSHLESSCDSPLMPENCFDTEDSNVLVIQSKIDLQNKICTLGVQHTDNTDDLAFMPEEKAIFKKSITSLVEESPTRLSTKLQDSNFKIETKFFSSSNTKFNYPISSQFISPRSLVETTPSNDYAQNKEQIKLKPLRKNNYSSIQSSSIERNSRQGYQNNYQESSGKFSQQSVGSEGPQKPLGNITIVNLTQQKID